MSWTWIVVLAICAVIFLGSVAALLLLAAEVWKPGRDSPLEDWDD
jgi:hypothetical protein